MSDCLSHKQVCIISSTLQSVCARVIDYCCVYIDGEGAGGGRRVCVPMRRGRGVGGSPQMYVSSAVVRGLFSTCTQALYTRYVLLLSCNIIEL